MVVSKHTTYVNYYPDKLTVKFAEVLDNVTELIETAQLKSYRDSPRPREPSYPDWLHDPHADQDPDKNLLALAEARDRAICLAKMVDLQVCGAHRSKS